jgi:hypothetical protein
MNSQNDKLIESLLTDNGVKSMKIGDRDFVIGLLVQAVKTARAYMPPADQSPALSASVDYAIAQAERLYTLNDEE